MPDLGPGVGHLVTESSLPHPGSGQRHPGRQEGRQSLLQPYKQRALMEEAWLGLELWRLGIPRHDSIISALQTKTELEGREGGKAGGLEPGKYPSSLRESSTEGQRGPERMASRQ